MGSNKGDLESRNGFQGGTGSEFPSSRRKSGTENFFKADNLPAIGLKRTGDYILLHCSQIPIFEEG